MLLCNFSSAALHSYNYYDSESDTKEDSSAELHALTQRLGLSDRVLFVGAKNPDRSHFGLGAADVFVLASDFEGCPNVILEAMACGPPVVATKVGDVERMVPSFAGGRCRAGRLYGLRVVVGVDTWRIRDHVSMRSWEDVARRVETQWLLAIKAFGAQKA